MEVLNHIRSSFRSSSRSTASSVGSDGSSNSLDTVTSSGSSTDGNNNSSSSRSSGSRSSSGSSGAAHKKKGGRHVCDLCGKRLIKLAGWRNYFTLPCRCRHQFCKQCITERLQCRQKVLRSASFSLMWTFPCPGNAACRQQLTVDFSRGSSFSKNLVATDLERDDRVGGEDDSWELDEFVEGGDSLLDESDVSSVGEQDASRLLEIG